MQRLLTSSSSSSKGPPTLVLIGLQGIGKTSLGKAIAALIHGFFHDGDHDIPKDSFMKKQVDNKLPVFKFQVDAYVKNHLIPSLRLKRQEAIAKDQPLVISQALFFNEHRYAVQSILGGDVYFLEVRGSSELQEKQIRERCLANKDSSLKTYMEIQFAKASNSHFQLIDPSLRGVTIDFQGKEHQDKFLKEFQDHPFYDAFRPYALREDIAYRTSSPPETKEVAPSSFYGRHPFFTTAVILGTVAVTAYQANLYRKGM